MMTAGGGGADQDEARLERIFAQAHEIVNVRERDRVDLDVTTMHDTRNYYTTLFEDGVLKIEVNDLFLGASDEVLEAFAIVLISRFYKKPYPPALWRKVRDYIYTNEVVAQAQAWFLEEDDRIDPNPKGECYDLDHVFETVNTQYFDGKVEKPALAWSRRLWYAKFGYYMEDHDAIVISRALDHFGIPRFVLEYVMFHEILHIVHGHLNISGASESHHYYFNIDEKKFERREEAEEWLEKLYKSKGRLTE